MNNRLSGGIAAGPIFAAALLTGCHGGATPELPLQGNASAANGIAQPAGLSKIKHVVIIVQENRSLNNLFMGFPRAHTSSYGFDSKKRKVTLKPIGLSTSWDLAHNSDGYYAACNGVGSIPGTDCTMNGFDRESWQCGKGGFPRCPIKYPPYSYVPRTEIKPYWDIAKQYVLADKMFASNFDASSYVSHQYIIAAQAAATTNYPLTFWGCPGGKTDTIGTLSPFRGPQKRVPVCFDYQTLGDELDAAGISWAYYAAPVGKAPSPCGQSHDDMAPPPVSGQNNGIWSAYQAVRHICYGPDWAKDVISPQTQFFTDVKDGNLRSVNWIVPTCVNSDHAGCNSDTGPSWVASLVNAVGESKYWNSTAILIFWDDYGGWYDAVPPPFVDYDGLGIRVPLLVVSPYAKKGFVSHARYEHGSILRFVEDRFGVRPLSASDQRSTSLATDCFDFSRRARTFVPIRAKYGESYFMHQPLDRRPPDTD
ncbi:MAG: hypothetical protein JO078_06765 [Candidatus Eremiobacteraeota bacterium]|nr:hypothetical protein [Candidatus Eremiobacteraeota bacterium]MBV9055459.1 hypothetical protein [Candidatus Eremiobacteraeota bacterium]MBV9699809.1 hypothetical protein [Candidatus Eremiobacteraeota bacterium]